MSHPKEILDSLGAVPLKRLSQNFLTSPHWAEKLITALTTGEKPDAYWEIGPGLGALTRPLLNTIDIPLTLFEFDRKLAAFLKKDIPQANLIEGDVLDADFETLIHSKKVALLSNLPYHISSQVLFKLIPVRENILRIVMTFQKEFADRLTAKVGDETYGALSIQIQLCFDIESIGVIPGSAFYPPPDIDSTALLLIPKPSIAKEKAAWISKVVKAAFLHPRKKMVNNLRHTLPGKDWSAMLLALGFNENTRAEELSKENYLKLAEASL